MAEIAILIPTLNRPEKLQPLIENINETTATDHHTYFVAELDDGETFLALEKLRAKDWTAIIEEAGSCARALNIGYRISTEPFVFTGNDDLWFHAGWDVAALDVLENFPIVGTNDGHDRMSCFAMVRRRYIERESGVYDEPNVLVHEYASQYPDTELAEYAKARGVWGEAPEAITEHRHWEFGKAEREHPNYDKAQETVAGDHATYLQRRQTWLSASAS